MTAPPQNAPIGSPLSALILIATIVVLATSPAKWQTFKKMIVAFFAMTLMIVLLGLVLSMRGYGNPEAFGEIAGMVAALLMGRQHVTKLKNQAKNESVAAADNPPSNPTGI